MREFFVQLYKDLRMLTGIKQYEEIASPGKSKEQAQADFDALINGCINVCSLSFPYIPDESKQRIIKAGVIEDPDFYGLFPRTVYKYLNKQKDKYFTESHHLETNAIEYEQPKELSPETQKLVDDYLEQLKKNAMDYKVQQTDLQNEIRRIQQEDKDKVNLKSVNIGYKPPTEDYIRMTELKREWGRKYHDLITGNKKEDWVSFEEWIETIKQP